MTIDFMASANSRKSKSKPFKQRLKLTKRNDSASAAFYQDFSSLATTDYSAASFSRRTRGSGKNMLSSAVVTVSTLTS